jgi:hypothetical protein
MLGVWIVAVVASRHDGRISGTVTDPQKAVVPGVTLQVTQLETGTNGRPSPTSTAGTVLNLRSRPLQVRRRSPASAVVRDQLTVAIGRTCSSTSKWAWRSRSR